VEQGVLFNAINFAADQLDARNLTVTAQSVSILLCPSEVNPQSYDDGVVSTAVTTYGWSMGDWYVWGGFGSLPTRGAFAPNKSRPIADFRDGLANTLLAAEVKSHQRQRLNCASLAQLSDPTRPTNQPPASVIPSVGGGTDGFSDQGHCSWADGQVAQTGFTTAWSPNTQVIMPFFPKLAPPIIGVGKPFYADLDLVGKLETDGGPTYAAVNSRSYHPGGVNVLMGDGTVRFVKDTINPNTWRALGSVNDGEIVSAEDY
jgi:prepilin-type processing-associated H-X9-DG protein